MHAARSDHCLEHQRLLRSDGGECAAGSGTDAIAFHIGSGPPTIVVASQLPSITAPVVIDGSAGPGGATRVELNGNNISASGLVLDGSIGSTIRRLVINRFNGNGIFLASSDNTSSKETSSGPMSPGPSTWATP